MPQDDMMIALYTKVSQRIGSTDFRLMHKKSLEILEPRGWVCGMGGHFVLLSIPEADSMTYRFLLNVHFSISPTRCLGKKVENAPSTGGPQGLRRHSGRRS
jgi:hypothetical protein